MSSLDARIRENLHLDHGDTPREDCLAEVIADVLDVCNDIAPYEHPDEDDIRTAIARRLGVQS